MKQGDLVIYKEVFKNNIPKYGGKPWLVLSVTKQKKSWHRVVFLYDGNNIINISWNEKDMFEVISEDR